MCPNLCKSVIGHPNSVKKEKTKSPSSLWSVVIVYCLKYKVHNYTWLYIYTALLLSTDCLLPFTGFLLTSTDFLLTSTGFLLTSTHFYSFSTDFFWLSTDFYGFLLTFYWLLLSSLVVPYSEELISRPLVSCLLINMMKCLKGHKFCQIK